MDTSLTPEQPQIPLKNTTLPKVKIRKVLLISAYLASIPCFVIFLILFSLTVKYQNNGYVSRQLHQPHFQALPSDSGESSVTIERQDGRIQALDEFFSDYDSPLYGYAQLIVEEADAHNIDYRLIPAIAMQESTLCRKVISDSHNCWGYGIYGGKVRKFASYEEGIKTVTESLARKYVKKGYDNPHEIVTKYTPSDTGRWAEVVTLIMSRLKERI